MSWLTTGKKEKLSISKDSEIEVCNTTNNGQGKFWYRASLLENLPKSKRKSLSVRHLNPLVDESYTPPLVTSTLFSLIRPVPPRDLFGEVDFEEGGVVDVVHRGGWWFGWVIKVLEKGRYSVFIESEVDVIEVNRRELRKHLVWKDDEWFQFGKKELIESEFSAGKFVEAKADIEVYGEVWADAMAIKDNEDETLLVKYKFLKGKDGECVKKSLPYSEIRPLSLHVGGGLRNYALLDKVEAQIEFGWCPGSVNKVLWADRYEVRLGRSNVYKSFDGRQLQPAVEWKKGGSKQGKEVQDGEESLHAVEDITPSTRIRITIPSQLTPHTGKNLRTTRSASAAMQKLPPAEARKVSVSESETQLNGTTAGLAGAVMNKNTPVVTIQPEIAASKESRVPVVLGVTSTPVTKSAVKTQGKTSPKKKLQTMKNQKGSLNDSAAVKAPEKTKTRENVHKRKRAQPKKFVSTEPKKNTGHSVAHTPDPMLNSVVEKHIDVVATPAVKDTTMVLPFVKKSPLWNVIESMDAFKAVPQRPHFSPLLECEEEFREGDAIGTMVKFTGLLEKLASIQVDDPVSLIKRYDECFVSLEKHGFNVTGPRSRIAKLLSMKESQKWAMEELKFAEREIAEKDNKRRKCEEDIVDVSRKMVELQKQGALLKEEKVTMDKEIALIQSQAVFLDQKVQNVEQEFRAIVATPW